MKKGICAILTLCIILFISNTSYAQTIENKDYGVGFILSDDWINTYDSDSISFYHKVTSEEALVIESIDADWAWSMEFADEDEVKQLCESLYSDSHIAKELSSQNGVYVSVRTDYAKSSYEYYNNVQYFRYEKAYTASAVGYYDTAFYKTVFVTAKNGKVYFISYHRNSESNHFADVVSMLNSLSFKSGEIKIKIDGGIIHPDSSPMLIEGRTLVPIRAVAEKMGYSVAWDGENQLVILTSSTGSTILHFEIGSNIALKNLSEIIELDVPAIIVGGRTYLPLRAVAEAMEANVNWNGAEKTVEINR